MADQGENTDRALVEAAQAGDSRALRALLDRFSRPLYAAVLLPRVGNPADAEDLLHETLRRAVEQLHTFRWTGAGVFPWLRQIAVHLVIDHVRRNQRRQRLEDRLEVEPSGVVPLHRADAEEEMIDRQERSVAVKAMESALETLNPRYRRAVELRFVEERPREACAEALGVTVGNFDVILHRAVAALRKSYGVR
jgi:RNA polymerase sigma-70 factor (ECF subfamily)